VSGDGLRVLSLCTGWSSDKGGVATVNRELSIALADLGHEVTARVSNEPAVNTPFGRVDVRVIHPTGTLDERGVLGIPADDLPGRVDVIIGHSRFSGPAAQKLRDQLYPDARVIHIVHMSVEELDRWRGDPQQAELHAATERQLIERADLAVGVGPLLYAETERFARMAGRVPPPVHQMIPGVTPVPAVSYINELSNRRYLHLFGRTDDPLKGADAAAGAVGILRQHGVDAHLIIRGHDKNIGNWAEREAYLNDLTRSRVRMKPYTTDHAEIVRDLRGADVVVMPSRHEGFGLVATEAAAHGVPILVSRDSGVGEFLRGLPNDLGHGLTVPEAHGRQSRARVWADHLWSRLEDLPRSREQAARLREHLNANYTWRHSATRLVEQIQQLPLSERASSASEVAPQRGPVHPQRLAPPRQVFPGRGHGPPRTPPGPGR
jgi:glycosyltransferase involved in cell wall biosynthesis